MTVTIAIYVISCELDTCNIIAIFTTKPIVRVRRDAEKVLLSGLSTVARGPFVFLKFLVVKRNEAISFEKNFLTVLFGN